ncbi:ABC transporter ATP-binding protein/permease [Myxococcota bacterium]|nr:ABC transporter ATP-binding protein/permease [Myxococcota bacterium]MBU1898146.1 ABC transporter ATP-binding protein/permease [Myxococcota bacterium]
MTDSIKPSAPASPSIWALLARLGPYLRAPRTWIIIAVATPLGVLAQLAQPLVLKQGVDAHLMRGELEGLGALIGLFALLVFGGFAARALGFFALQRLGLRAITQLRRDVLRHVLNQGQRFFDQRTIGGLMTRTTNDIDAIYESLAMGAVWLIADAMVIVGTLIAMLLLDVKLTLLTLTLAPPIILIVNLFRKKLRVLFTHVRKELATLNGFFAEQLEGVSVTQLYGAQAQAKARFRGLAWRYLDHYRRANWWDAGLYAIMDGLSALAMALVLGYASARLGAGVSLGLLIAFIDYLQKVFGPIREFSGRVATLQGSVAALDRVWGLLDVHEEIIDGATPLPHLRGEVVFKGVSFAYSEGGVEVLRGVDLRIAPGEVVALVGATGSGKTTLARLLQRIYQGYRGSLTLDGVELSDLRLADLRRQISVVAQDPYLFEATVAENIGLWAPEIDAATRRAAMVGARLADWVDGWPEGEARRLTARGADLSAGQRQLLSITRALAHPRPFVILDEATASVDSLTEDRVDEALAALFEGRTALVIAHRLSTIAKADRVVVLHKGVVVEEGDHATLMARGGRYALLVESGFAL